MSYDYILFDDKLPPVTNVPIAVIKDLKNQALASADFKVIYQEDGLLLLGHRGAFERDKIYWQGADH